MQIAKGTVTESRLSRIRGSGTRQSNLYWGSSWFKSKIKLLEVLNSVLGTFVVYSCVTRVWNEQEQAKKWAQLGSLKENCFNHCFFFFLPLHTFNSVWKIIFQFFRPRLQVLSILPLQVAINSLSWESVLQWLKITLPSPSHYLPIIRLQIMCISSFMHTAEVHKW